MPPCPFCDGDLEPWEDELSGDLLVACPDCGAVFDPVTGMPLSDSTAIVDVPTNGYL